MIRIHVICEGQTEETFINEVLSEVFYSKGMYLIPSLLGKPGHKGGNLKFDRLFLDVRARLLGDSTAYCTTFFDFYGLPNDFPGKAQADKHSTAEEKFEKITQALSQTLISKMGEKPLQRFIPYVQMYEFEGLLFSDPEKFATSINHTHLVPEFQAIKESFNSPEEINNSPNTAPSKRIKSLCPSYDKPVWGSLAAMEIGIEIISRECLLFNHWLQQLRALK